MIPQSNEKQLVKHSYEEVYSETLKYFNGDTLATEVWINKYCIKDSSGNLYEKSPEDMHRRMAKEFAKIEQKYPNPLSEEEIFQKFKKFKNIIPQGSVMSVLGNPFVIGSLSNCIVLPKIYDSYGGIMYTDQQLTQLYKRRCGVGLDISTLRPKGMSVKNSAGSTTGAVSFMERFSNTTREVGQDNRRGALMITIDIAHPDVEEFIDIKNDLKKVTGANISVKLTDEFMRAVKKNTNFTLRFPVDSKIEDAKYVKQVNANTLWNKIIKSAHNSAEPGIIFWDNQHWYSTSSIYPGYENISTNPCCFYIGEDVFVVTNNGIKEIKTVTSEDLIWVDDKKEWVKNSGYFTVGKHSIYKVCFNNGEELYITDNHKLPHIKKDRSTDFVLTELKDLKVGDKIKIHLNEVDGYNWGKLGNYNEGLILGWLSGDGCLSFKSSDDEFPIMHLSFWKNDFSIIPLFENAVSEIDDVKSSVTSYKLNRNEVRRISSSKLTKYFTEKYEMNLWKFRQGKNRKIFEFSKDFVKGYLSAYFSSDGTISCRSESSGPIIQAASINLDKLKEIKYLLNIFGIKSSISVLREGGLAVFRGKEYKTKKIHRLTITGIYSVSKFINEIGFLNDYKKKIEEEIIEMFSGKQTKQTSFARIKSIEYFKDDDVGCISLDKYHYFTANGLLVGNSEIAMNFDSCRLMVVNYYSYVENPFTQNARFNFEELYKDVYFAQRLMDDLVDLELEAVEKIINKVKSDPEPDYIKEIEIRTWEELYTNGKKGRRTGLGFTGLGDTLAALGVKYDSDVAIGLIDKISKTKMLAEFESSIDMAIERGAFDGFNPEHENRSLFVQMIKTEFPNLYEKMMYHGRRNISISTVAPTGSLSLLTQTSSGIEPVYMIYYTRRRKLNPNDKSSRVDFVDELGDKWQEYTVFHPKFETYMKSIGMSDEEIYNIKENGTKEQIDEIVKNSPYYDATAMDIDWQKRVQAQATVQKYVTHSISSTVNLPENVEVKTVGDIYMNAWENKLKGITIYRDGSRSGVLVSKKDKEQQENDLLFKDNHAPKRPKRLKADILRFQNNMEKWIAVVGLLDGRPYEIFTGKLENGLSELSPNIITCEVVKVKLPEGKTRYDIEYVDSKGEKITHTGLNHTFNKEFWNYAKMASAILRHGMPLTYAVELINSLNLADDHLNTWKNGVSRVLKRYIKEGTIKGKCDNCGGENLEFIEGCLTCKDCGSSKCS